MLKIIGDLAGGIGVLALAGCAAVGLWAWAISGRPDHEDGM